MFQALNSRVVLRLCYVTQVGSSQSGVHFTRERLPMESVSRSNVALPTKWITCVPATNTFSSCYLFYGTCLSTLEWNYEVMCGQVRITWNRLHTLTTNAIEQPPTKKQSCGEVCAARLCLLGCGLSDSTRPIGVCSSLRQWLQPLQKMQLEGSATSGQSSFTRSKFFFWREAERQTGRSRPTDSDRQEGAGRQVAADRKEQADRQEGAGRQTGRSRPTDRKEQADRQEGGGRQTERQGGRRRQTAVY
jgi:hypothetical protein